MSRIIQDKIDEYKEQLPDQLYIELCALTMKENKKEEENKLKEYDFYEIKYAYPSHFYDDDGDNNFKLSIKTTIVKLKLWIADRIADRIRDDGYFPAWGICLRRRDNGGYENVNIIEEDEGEVVNYSRDENKPFCYQSHSTILSIKKA